MPLTVSDVPVTLLACRCQLRLSSFVWLTLYLVASGEPVQVTVMVYPSLLPLTLVGASGTVPPALAGGAKAMTAAIIAVSAMMRASVAQGNCPHCGCSHVAPPFR